MRYFNAAGASPDNTHGYKQEKASHIVPIISRKILAGENVEVFGNDYDTADGTCERDYTHMFDIATAHLAADNYLSDGGESDIFNIGAGNSMSVLQVINAFERVLDTTVHYEFVPRRDGDAPKTFADNTKAREAFGWEPLYGLDEIVAHGHAWEEKNFKK